MSENCSILNQISVANHHVGPCCSIKTQYTEWNIIQREQNAYAHIFSIQSQIKQSDTPTSCMKMQISPDASFVCFVLGSFCLVLFSTAMHSIFSDKRKNKMHAARGQTLTLGYFQVAVDSLHHFAARINYNADGNQLQQKMLYSSVWMSIRLFLRRKIMFRAQEGRRWRWCDDGTRTK